MRYLFNVTAWKLHESLDDDINESGCMCREHSRPPVNLREQFLKVIKQDTLNQNQNQTNFFQYSGQWFFQRKELITEKFVQ